jgi:hypothetical protein
MSNLLERIKVLFSMIFMRQRIDFPRSYPPNDSAEPLVDAEPDPSPTNALANVLAADVILPPPEQPVPALPNRAERRARLSEERRKFERERKKFDKFLEPKGPQPTKYERASGSLPKKEIPPGITVSDNGPLIVDVHYSDRKTEVLYEEGEIYGNFNFRDSILEQLDSYFVYLDRMRKNDPDAWELYKQIGAVMVPYASTPDIMRAHEEGYAKDKLVEYKDPIRLSPWFLRTRPAFGCLVYGANPEAERIELDPSLGGLAPSRKKTVWIPKFMYFCKYSDPPPEIQPVKNGDVYVVTVWWDRPQDQKMEKKLKGAGVPNCFGIAVSCEGDIRALRQIETKMVPILSKRYGTSHIPQRFWRMPHAYDDWAKQHNTNVQQLLCGTFESAAHKLETSAFAMARVSVRKGDRYATFSISMDRIPYFFKDRDYALTAAGRRKRIFHMVKPHVRANGEAVTFSFRGEREFTWAGYDVAITIPGRDHPMVEEFNVPSLDSHWKKRKKKYVTEGEIGRRFRSMIRNHTFTFR